MKSNTSHALSTYLLCYEPLFEPSLHGKCRERVGKRPVRPARPLVSDVVGGIHQLVTPSHEPREQVHGVRDDCILSRAHPDGGKESEVESDVVADNLVRPAKISPSRGMAVSIVGRSATSSG